MPGEFCCKTCRRGTPCERLVHDGFLASAVLRIRGRQQFPVVSQITEQRLEQIEDLASRLRTRVSRLEGRQRIRASLIRTASAQYTATVLDESHHTLPNHYGGFGPLSDTEQLERTSLEATPVVIQQPVPVAHAHSEAAPTREEAAAFALLPSTDGFGIVDSDTRSDILAYFMLQERDGC